MSRTPGSKTPPARRDGAVLATGGSGPSASDLNNEVMLWDISDPLTPKRLGDPLVQHHAPVIGLSFSADGRTLWSANKNVSLIRWNVSDPTRPRHTATAMPDRLDTRSSIAFRPDHRAIASGGTGGVVIRDISSPNNVKLLDRPMSDHTALKILFSNNGNTLITGGDDVLIWDVSTPSQPRRYGSMLGAGKNITALALSADDKTLVVGDFLTGVTLWNVEDPAHPYELGASLSLSDPGVTAVAISPNGRMIATASGTGGVRLWDVSRLQHLHDHLEEEACARAQRGLTEDEWIRHVGSHFPHRQTCT